MLLFSSFHFPANDTTSLGLKKVLLCVWSVFPFPFYLVWTPKLVLYCNAVVNVEIEKLSKHRRVLYKVSVQNCISCGDLQGL